MLLADRPESPGLLDRPRPDRLEAGTEFLETRDDLVAATLFFLASSIRTWEDERANDRRAVLRRKPEYRFELDSKPYAQCRNP